MPRDESIRKILVIGSGPIVIGQAAEFDYSGTQACSVLRQEGIELVLINSNPATIMTDGEMAASVYLEPLTLETVRKVILREKPDSLLASMGGQTALTLAMQLSHEGFLACHDVRLIGTNVEAIDKAEDRRLFKETMAAIGQPTIPSGIADTMDEARAIAADIGFPVIIRPAYTLGGSGGGIAHDDDELEVVAAVGLETSPIHQVLVERYIFGWKEIEFEVIRDGAGNAITVCSMENFDPVGVHTGDSIVVAPALTLADREYQMLRSAALDIIAEMGIEGGCNCQFALNPESFEYAVIEVNPRVSRSSALASKATGYPIAKVATKIALGYTLDEIRNEVTGTSCACFEPALDYVVVKVPRWPFDKFHGISHELGSQMKATGEVMAIGSSFEAALLKAIRGSETGQSTLDRSPSHTTHEETASRSLEERLAFPDDLRPFTIFEALKAGYSVAEVHRITKVDAWFVGKLANLVAYERDITENGLDERRFRKGKRLGYTDASLEELSGSPLVWNSVPTYKMVDTCAAEYTSATPYFYATRDAVCDAEAFPRSGRDTVMILGSGPIRIGQGIEFDYCSVRCAHALRRLGYDVVIINNNPETVSTDYDTSDRLYFEPLTPEDVMDVISKEKPIGVVVAFGGQTAIRLTSYLAAHGVRILGTSAEGIDIAEDRERFDALLSELGISRPQGHGTHSLDEALAAAEALGYPVLLRPSYVIGGQNMVIAHDAHEVRRYMTTILEESTHNSVLVDKYMPGVELEVDVISDGVDVLLPGIMEHIERAGIHSGDSIAVYPPFNLSATIQQKVVECSQKMALALGTVGLVNIQYLVYDDELYVIEMNPRASRTVPYLSKVSGLPIIDVATAVMMGATLESLGYAGGLYQTPSYFAAKVPVFSFEKLLDANSLLGPEMKSTGEVLGIGRTLPEALFKGFTAAGYRCDNGEDAHGTQRRCAFLSVDAREIPRMLELARTLYRLGLKLYATPDTAAGIRGFGLPVVETGLDTCVARVRGLVDAEQLRLMVYTGALHDDTFELYLELHRVTLRAQIPCITSLDTAAAFADILDSRFTEQNTELIDLNDIGSGQDKLRFTKMHGCGNDYLYIDCFSQTVQDPHTLAPLMADRHTGVGGDGIVLVGPSNVADGMMRMFNADGSEGKMCGNAIRCVGKYLYESGIARKNPLTVETLSGIKTLELRIRDEQVLAARVDMGAASFAASTIPVALATDAPLVQHPLVVDGVEYRITCVSMGNPHCVVFCDDPDTVDLERVGPLFEHHALFPEGVNTEFVQVLDDSLLKMRVWERGSGETQACGTGSCAAVAAAVACGFCTSDTDVRVLLRGGILIINYTDETVYLEGEAVRVFEGTWEA